MHTGVRACMHEHMRCGTSVHTCVPTYLPAAHLPTYLLSSPARGCISATVATARSLRTQVLKGEFRIRWLNTEKLSGAAEESYNTLSSGKMMVPASKRQLFTSIKSVKPRSALLSDGTGHPVKVTLRGFLQGHYGMRLLYKFRLSCLGLRPTASGFGFGQRLRACSPRQEREPGNLGKTLTYS